MGKQTQRTVVPADRPESELLSVFCELAQACCIILSKNGTITSFTLNGANLRMLELAAPIGTKFISLVSENTKQLFRHFLQQAFKTRTKVSCELSLAVNDRLLVVSLNGIVTGDPEQCLVSMTEITERKLVEDSLVETQAILKGALDNSRAGIIISDAPGGTIRYVNEAALLIGGGTYASIAQGIGPEEYVSKWHLFDMQGKPMVPDDMPLTRAIRYGESNIRELLVRRQTGDDRIVIANASPIFDKTGNLIAGIVVFMDITENRLVEKKLRESEEQYRNIEQSANDAIITIDRGGTITGWNDSAERIFGYRRDEIAGKTLDAIIPSALLSSHKEGVRRMEHGGEAQMLGKPIELTGIHRNGDKIQIEISLAAWKSSSGNYYTGIIRDITERKLIADTQQFLLEGGSLGSGELFFRNLAGYLARTLGMNYVCIDRLVGDGLEAQTVAIYNDGNFDANVKYALKDTPCGVLVGKTICCFNEQVSSLFPHDPALQELNAESYIGTTLRSNDGHPIGLIAVIGRKPLRDPYLAEVVLKMVSISATAELERGQKEAELLESKQRLEMAQRSAGVGIWDWNMENDQLTWSAELFNLFGLDPQKHKATFDTWLDIIYPEDREIAQMRINESIEKTTQLNSEYRVIIDGEVRWIAAIGNTICDSQDRTVRMTGICMDITRRKNIEEALSFSEKLFRESQMAANIGSYSLDLGTGIWQASEEIYRIFGIDKDYPHTLEGWTNCIKPEFRAQLLSLFHKTFEESDVFDQEYKIIRHNDGEERWVNGLGVFENDQHGRPQRLIGTIQDITKRKQAEEAIKQLNEDLEQRVNSRTIELSEAINALQSAKIKYRTVADFTHDWEFWTDPDGQMLYCSPTCERVTGYSEYNFMHDPGLMGRIIHPADRKKFQCHKHQEDAHMGGNREIQFRIILPDESVKWIGHVCRPVYSASGDFMGTRGSNRDITTRKQIENQLKAINNKYKLVSHNIRDGVFICKNGQLEYYNKAMSHHFGYSQQELDGIQFGQLITAPFQAQVQELLSGHHLGNHEKTLEMECRRKDHSTFLAEIYFNYAAKERLFYGVLYDITEKKQNQKNIIDAIIQTEEKERTNFSKELHDGLGPLLSLVKLYLQWAQKPKGEISVDQIILKAIPAIDDALATVKEISNKLSPGLLTQRGLITALETFIDKLRESSDIRITLHSDFTRRMDLEKEATLYRAAIECINNTIRHAEASSITINLNDLGRKVWFQYKDDGKGFDIPGVLSRNAGLGLFNLRSRIENLGGKIMMSSLPGKGVHYEVYIDG